MPPKIPSLLVLIAAVLALGCAPIPKGRYTLDSVHMSGNDELDDDEIEGVIASQPSARFLGLFSGVIYEYEVFDRFVLERDLQRIERYYRARGFYEARARAARVVYSGRGAKVYIEVEEGKPVVLRRVDVHGIETLPQELRASLERDVFAKLGGGDEPFAEKNFEEAETLLKEALENQGYAYLRLKRAANVDLPRHRASAGFWVDLGPTCVLGSVKIEGLGPFPEPPVRRALDLKEGDPYSRSDLEEAKRAILGLNVFSSVSIEPEMTAEAVESQRKNSTLRVPIRVELERSKVRSVKLGIGLKLDSQRTDVHLLAGWEHNNFFGGFRRFQVDITPGLVLFPTRLPDFQAPELLVPEVRLRAEFRQPGFLEARTNALVRGEASIYVDIPPGEYNPKAPVRGYQDLRLATGLERSLWRLYGVLTQNVQFSKPFNYREAKAADDMTPPPPEYMDSVLVAYPELFLSLDLRDDRVSPHKGAYFSLNAQTASLFGDARDIKLQPEARAFVPVSRKVTLALRGTVGFLFPRNYGDTVVPNIEGAQFPDIEAWNKDLQIMYLRGLFSGGAGSNRGYATREVGPHGRVYYYNPAQIEDDDACRNPDSTISQACTFPLGGFSLWEFSAELRFPLAGPISAATFADASDVSPYEWNLRFSRPHLSAGVGLRYDTPIGPVRLDLGWRIPGLQTLDPEDTKGEGTPATIGDLPLAASFGIGQVF